MAPAETLEPCGVQLGGRATGQEDFDFFGDANRMEMMGGADQDRRLGGVRETGSFWSDLEGISLASLMPAMALVQGEVPRQKKRRGAPWRGGRVSQRAWIGCS